MDYDIEDLMEMALFDDVIELECEACGGTLRCEPDARDTYCYECDRLVPTNNPLIKLGLI